MAIKYRKDESKAIAKYRLTTNDGKHYYHVYLWRDRKAFEENSDGDNSNAAGCVNFVPTIIEFSKGKEKEITRPKLGDIHLIAGKWTTEIIAHELCHALLHRLRVCKYPSINHVMEQDADSEEDICYEFGEWFDKLYSLLWKDDQPKGWEKSKNLNKKGKQNENHGSEIKNNLDRNSCSCWGGGRRCCR